MNTENSNNDGFTEQVNIIPIDQRSGLTEEDKTTIRLHAIENSRRVCEALFGDTGNFTSGGYWRADDPQVGDVSAVLLESLWYWKYKGNDVKTYPGRGDFFIVQLFADNEQEISDTAWWRFFDFLMKLDSEDSAEREKKRVQHETWVEIGWKDRIYRLVLKDGQKKERSFKNVQELVRLTQCPPIKLKRYLDSWAASGDQHRFTVQYTQRGEKDRSIKLTATTGYDLHLELAKEKAEAGYQNQKRSEVWLKEKMGSDRKYPDTREEDVLRYQQDSVERAEKELAEAGLSSSIQNIFQDPAFGVDLSKFKVEEEFTKEDAKLFSQ